MRLLPLVGLLLFFQAHALTFQTRLEKAVWQVEGDQFECRLMQPVTNFGAGGFVRRAGESARFRLWTREPWFSKGAALLVAAAAPWQAGYADISLGSVQVQPEEDKPFDSTAEQAGRLLTGLLQGRSPLVRHREPYGKDPLEVRLLPVRFEKAYNDYLACVAKLLPVNFEQIRQSQINFSSTSDVVLDARAKAQLDRVLLYIKADPTVNRINLDGHSDNGHDRLTNRELSRQRALAVQSYLVGHGFPQNQITLRFHGERYPLVSNKSKADRVHNCRVTVSASREAPEEPAAPPASEASNTPNAAS